jgi:mono/diheme cytochrome c family protein
MVLCLAGCQQEMARQPAYRPLQPSTFFADGQSARPLVAGTVHRDYQTVVWKKSSDLMSAEKAAAMIGKLPGDPLGAAGATAVEAAVYVDAFPLEITEKVLARGEERFNIYCAVCHDRVGMGKGMIVQRGFTAPPNLHTDLSRGFKLNGIDLKLTAAPVGYYFEVITKGFGAMPDYASQIPPNDRWAIIAYVRVLQFSQDATLNDVRDDQQKRKLLQEKK